MRNRLAALATLAVTAVIAGCAAAAPPPDAYQQVATAAQTTWDPIQVNVGVTFTAQGKTVTLDPKDMAFVLDTKGERGAFHLSIAAAELGVPASAFEKLGVTGDSIDFDMVFSSGALYIKSALLAPTLRMLLGPVGKLPAGDLTGWLKLGTKDELAAFAAMSGAAFPRPSVAPASGDPSADPKTSMEAAGVTLAIVGVEKRNGSDLQRIKIAVDTAKLVESPFVKAGAAGNPQSAQSLAIIKGLSIGGDLWLDPGTHRIVETDFHLAPANGGTDSGDVTVTAKDPDGSVQLDAPSATVDIPIAPLFNEMMKLISKGAES